MSEGEQEELWLQDAGLSPLEIGEGEEVDKVVLMSTLTRTQAAAVQRRIDLYTCSLRKRNKTPTRHVKDIFDSPLTQVISPAFLYTYGHWTECFILLSNRRACFPCLGSLRSLFRFADKLLNAWNDVKVFELRAEKVTGVIL